MVPTRKGGPWWSAVAIALVLTMVGAAADGVISGQLSWGLRLGFWFGVVAAVLFVRRGSLFTAMVQPPLVLVFGVLVGGIAFTATSGLYATALRVIATFPTMLIGTLLVLMLGGIRIYAQPLRRSTAARPRATAGHH
ncbi:hypothetical protein GCM10009818_04310 [Nakamurella flavida]